jgi:hypothetical protein
VLHTCGLRTDGLAYCWGSGANGRLGNGATQTAILPVAVAGGHLFTSLTLGDAHTCGLRNDGVVLCWGSNQSGRIGDATTADRLEPTPISNSNTFAAVAAGGSHTCALTTAGAALCWGAGNSGQLGTGTATPQQIVPVPVAGGTIFSKLAAGFLHTCALQADGTAYCWGSNANGSGRLGDGTTTQRPAPVAVVGGAKFTDIAAGTEHTCGRSTAGSAICWGRNQEGQLGDKSTATRSSPSGVQKP